MHLSLTRPFVLLLLLLSLPACGIEFRSSFDGTEVFRDLSLDGDFETGNPITVTLTVKQVYPVPVAISCRYEDRNISDDERKVAFNERTISVFETVLAANPGLVLADKDDVPDEVFQFDFIVPQAGRYFIACFAVAAPENGMGQRFTIRTP